jgi:hypothetical protein
MPIAPPGSVRGRSGSDSACNLPKAFFKSPRRSLVGRRAPGTAVSGEPRSKKATVINLDNLMAAVQAEPTSHKRLGTLLQGLAVELRASSGSQPRTNRVADWLDTERGVILSTVLGADKASAAKRGGGEV